MDEAIFIQLRGHVWSSTYPMTFSWCYCLGLISVVQQKRDIPTSWAIDHRSNVSQSFLPKATGESYWE